MATIKKIISPVLSAVIILSAGTAAFAYDKTCDNKSFATAVEEQLNDDCSYYALLSTAESYAVKVCGAAKDEADFSEKSLEAKTGKTDNFGEVLYSSVRCNLGDDYYITGIENLTNRGDRYIKEKIKENGAVTAVIALPDGGMKNEKYYSKDNAAWYCPEEDCTSGDYHAFSIVGFRDDFNKGAFNVKPKKNGAWLCKNSYGPEYGDNGYFWLPYSAEFTFVTAVEVSKFEGISSVKSANGFFGSFNYLSAIGFRSMEELKKAEVVAEDERILYKANIDVVNGYNFIPLEKKYLTSGVTVTVNGYKIDSKNVFMYFCYDGDCTLNPSKAEKDENWDVELDNLTISPGENGRYIAYSITPDNVTISHPVKLSSVDNKVCITPCDGTFFAKDMDVQMKMKVYGKDDIEDVENPYDYLEFSDDGQKIYFKSRDIGGAFVTGINITTDEKGNVSSVSIVEDNGSGNPIKCDAVTVEKYKNNGTNTIEIPGKKLSSTFFATDYFAVINVDDSFFFADDVKVMLNGENVSEISEIITTDGESFSVGMVIEIPSVTSNIIEIIFEIIPKFFGSLTSAFAGLFKSRVLG